jgi:hypothetical protein
VLVRTLEPCKGESLDGLSNKPLELEHAVATAGGNRAVSPSQYRPRDGPLKARHWDFQSGQGGFTGDVRVCTRSQFLKVPMTRDSVGHRKHATGEWLRAKGP